MPLHLCKHSARHVGLQEPLKPCEGRRKPGAEPQAHLSCNLHLPELPHSRACCMWHWATCQATPRSSQVFQATQREANHCLDVLVFPAYPYHHCLLGFLPGPGSRTYVSGCLFLLHFTSALEVFLHFLFQVGKNCPWDHDGQEAARHHDSSWDEWRERHRKYVILKFSRWHP